MKRSIVAAVVGLGLVLASSTQVEAQLTNFPVYAVPSANGNPSSIIAAAYGRGLNEFSGEQNAFALAYTRTGIGDRVGVSIGAGMITYDPDSEFTFGGNVGFDLLGPDANVQIGLQAGVGYISPAEDFSTTSVPFGVAVKGMEAGGSANFGWWFMPRLQYTRVSVLGTSDGTTDFGASAGGSIGMSSGFGIHAAVDLLAADENIWHGSVGLFYNIG